MQQCRLFRFRMLAVIALTGLVAAPAFAGTGAATGPWELESADYLPRGSAELSLWQAKQRHTGVSSNHAELGVRPVRHWQFGIEVSTLRPIDENRVSRARLQAKTLWRELFQDGYGAGLVFDLGYNSSDDRIDAGRLTLPVTIETSDDRIAFHLNVAADYLRDHDDEVAAAWAAGTNLMLADSAEFIAEVFGEDRGERPEVQSGLRFWFGERELSVDLAWRRLLESGANESWAVGFGLHTVRF